MSFWSARNVIHIYAPLEHQEEYKNTNESVEITDNLLLRFSVAHPYALIRKDKNGY